MCFSNTIHCNAYENLRGNLALGFNEISMFRVDLTGALFRINSCLYIYIIILTDVKLSGVIEGLDMHISILLSEIF